MKTDDRMTKLLLRLKDKQTETVELVTEVSTVTDEIERLEHILANAREAKVTYHFSRS